MRAIDDVEAIYASIQELRKAANGLKPRCPRHDNGFCNKPCPEFSDCFIDWERANRPPPTAED